MPYPDTSGVSQPPRMGDDVPVTGTRNHEVVRTSTYESSAVSKVAAGLERSEVRRVDEEDVCTPIELYAPNVPALACPEIPHVERSALRHLNSVASVPDGPPTHPSQERRLR